MSNGQTMTINKAQVRSFAFRIQPVVRPGWEFTQISEEVYEDLNQLVMKAVRESLKKHPTMGKTFRWIQ